MLIASTQSRRYVGAFLALVLLTCLTVGLGYVEIGPLHALVGLTIAAVKCILIVIFFMHLLENARLNRVVVLSGLLWLIILMTLSLSDFMTRDWLP
jgi:cytochrome c oxidase subunit IV